MANPFSPTTQVIAKRPLDFTPIWDAIRNRQEQDYRTKYLGLLTDEQKAALLKQGIYPAGPNGPQPAGPASSASTTPDDGASYGDGVIGMNRGPGYRRSGEGARFTPQVPSTAGPTSIADALPSSAPGANSTPADAFSDDDASSYGATLNALTGGGQGARTAELGGGRSPATSTATASGDPTYGAPPSLATTTGGTTPRAGLPGGSLDEQLASLSGAPVTAHLFGQDWTYDPMAATRRGILMKSATDEAERQSRYRGMVDGGADPQTASMLAYGNAATYLSGMARAGATVDAANIRGNASRDVAGINANSRQSVAAAHDQTRREIAQMMNDRLTAQGGRPMTEGQAARFVKDALQTAYRNHGGDEDAVTDFLENDPTGQQLASQAGKNIGVLRLSARGAWEHEKAVADRSDRSFYAAHPEVKPPAAPAAPMRVPGAVVTAPPTAAPSPAPTPASAPRAAAPKAPPTKPLAARVQELKAQGLSKEQARAQLQAEGYTLP